MTTERIVDLKTDAIVGMLFAIVGDNVGNVLTWLYGNNTALDGRPIDLIYSGRIDDVFGYLHFYCFGPY